MNLTEIRNELNRIARKKKSKKTLSKKEISFLEEMKLHPSNPIRSEAAHILPNETPKRLKKDPDFGFLRELGKDYKTAMQVTFACVKRDKGGYLN